MAVRTKLRNKAFVNFLEWLFVWEFIFFSGNSGIPALMQNGLLAGGPRGIIVLATCLLLWWKKSDKKYDILQFSLMLLIVVFFFSSGIAAGNPFTQLISTPAIVVCMYLVLSISDFFLLRERIRKALSKLCAVTLITYAVYMATGIGVTSGGSGKKLIFYIFTDWGGRPASIYQEPGQFQIMICFVLVLFVDELVKINMTNIRYYIRKFGMIIAALLASQSSMGYICFMILVALLFTFNKSSKRNILLYAVLLTAGVIGAFLLWQSDTIQQKIDPANMLNSRSSLAERLVDSIMLFRMSFISPWLGLGPGSADYFYYGAAYGGFRHGVGVNGWLNVAVCYGWPFFFLITGSMLFGLRRMKQGIPPLLVFIVLFLSQANETNALSYTTYLYVFKFNSYVGQEENQLEQNI